MHLVSIHVHIASTPFLDGCVLAGWASCALTSCGFCQAPTPYTRWSPRRSWPPYMYFKGGYLVRVCVGFECECECECVGVDVTLMVHSSFLFSPTCVMHNLSLFLSPSLSVTLPLSLPRFGSLALSLPLFISHDLLSLSRSLYIVSLLILYTSCELWPIWIVVAVWHR